MKKQILLAAFVLALFAAYTGVANAQIIASITVKDPNGNIISGKAVPINTLAHVYGSYEDQGGNSQATGLLQVFFNDGSGPEYAATLWSGTLNDGDSVAGTPYAMAELGTYEFRWTCQKIGEGAFREIRCEERTQTRTTVRLTTPEPGTIAGLSMALAALAILTVKKTRAKK